MENYRASASEREQTLEVEVTPPMVDILKDADRVAEIFPDQAAELTAQIEHHNQAAHAVTEYLDRLEQGNAGEAEKSRYYGGVADLLGNPDLQRLVLFLPFESFPTTEETSESAEKFRESFVASWSQLFYTHDARANFVDGDVPEIEARASDPERVVKAAHLIPWVVKSGIVDLDEVVDFVASIDNPVLTRSLLDTEPLLRDFDLLDDKNAVALRQMQENLPPQPEVLPPKFITPQRQAWLERRERPVVRPASRLRDLGRNLSERLPELDRELAEAREIAEDLDPVETYRVVWFGGSRLKGYATDESDTDFWVPVKIADNTESIHTFTVDTIRDDPARRASLVFDTVWVGDTENIQNLQREILPIYFGEQNQDRRNYNTERLEQDLLEYRLLHEHYQQFYPDSNPEYKKYTQLDGQSAFYETSYRIIATKIFANSIFIPRVK